VYKRLETPLAVQRWDLLRLDAPEGTRDPIVLHSDDGARAVLVVLQPGQSLRDHQVKENAWVVVVDGSVRISVGGEESDAGAGTLVHFVPDERHALSSDAGARILMLLAPWPGEGHYRGNATVVG
jgi:quercetin dioxygenase-like cupin family protein